MGIRVRIRLLMEEKGMETAALVNSGFESSEPDICIPIGLAKRMGLWPSLKFESEASLRQAPLIEKVVNSLIHNFIS
jgi:hypothetical protein